MKSESTKKRYYARVSDPERGIEFVELPPGVDPASAEFFARLHASKGFTLEAARAAFAGIKRRPLPTAETPED